MRIYTLFIFLTMSIQSTNVFDFNSDTKPNSWQIVNDDVMGGRSSSSLVISEAGHGVFKGHVSLANNGGFASVRHEANFEDVADYTHVVLKLKGDGKNYQFRLKASQSQSHSYVQEFKTNGEWQEIELKLSDFYPQFRGRKLNMANFDFENIAEMAFLIGNKREEDFKLIIDQISLQ